MSDASVYAVRYTLTVGAFAALTGCALLGLYLRRSYFPISVRNLWLLSMSMLGNVTGFTLFMMRFLRENSMPW